MQNLSNGTFFAGECQGHNVQEKQQELGWNNSSSHGGVWWPHHLLHGLFRLDWFTDDGYWYYVSCLRLGVSLFAFLSVLFYYDFLSVKLMFTNCNKRRIELMT